MVNQNNIFSFEIKRQTRNVFSSDIERTVVKQIMQNFQLSFWESMKMFHMPSKIVTQRSKRHYCIKSSVARN